MDNIEDLIKKFNDTNGNRNYTTRDLLKYIIGRIDDFDSKLDGINLRLDNHITTNESRLTAIETTISNIKWAFGGIGVSLVAIFIKLIS